MSRNYPAEEVREEMGSEKLKIAWHGWNLVWFFGDMTAETSNSNNDNINQFLLLWTELCPPPLPAPALALILMLKPYLLVSQNAAIF